MKTEADEKQDRFPLTPLRALVASIGIYIASQIVAVSLVAVYVTTARTELDLETWLEGSVFAQFAVYLLISAIGISAIWLIIRRSRESWRSIGLKKPALVDIFYALGGYACYFMLYFVSVLVLGLLVPEIDFEQQQQIGFSREVAGLSLAAVFVSLVVLPPLYEELLARGLLYTGLRTKLKVWTAALITSLLFAAAHLQWGEGAPLLWAAAIDTFVLSLILIWLREKTGSLWPAIGLHAIKNCIAFLLLFVFNVS